MHTLTDPNRTGVLVDADTLSCPGCHETVIPEPPLMPGPGVVVGTEFSHSDGSELCPDGCGRVCDPDRGSAMTSTDTRTRPATGTGTTKAKTKTAEARAGKTPEERVAEVEALAEQLTAAVVELTTGAAWVAMLRVAARFTRYSPNNALLLWMQSEQRGVTLTRVAGYRAWQAMGRQVVKGARSFAVMAPVRRRLTAAEAAERAQAGQHPAYDRDGRPAMVVRGFRLERVFRYEDTEGEALPEVGYVTGDTPDGAWDALAALVERDGYLLTTDIEIGGARGHTNYTDRIVNVDPGLPLAERTHVLIHELGHIRAGHGTRREVSRAQRETEAESVAFIVATVLGLDAGEVAAVYVSGWTDGDTATITAAQGAIHHTARSILADLEQDDTEEIAEEEGAAGASG